MMVSPKGNFPYKPTTRVKIPPSRTETGTKATATSASLLLPTASKQYTSSAHPTEMQQDPRKHPQNIQNWSRTPRLTANIGIGKGTGIGISISIGIGIATTSEETETHA